MEIGLVVPLPISVQWEKGTVTQTLTVREALYVVETTAKTSGLGQTNGPTAVLNGILLKVIKDFTYKGTLLCDTNLYLDIY